MKGGILGGQSRPAMRPAVAQEHRAHQWVPAGRSPEEHPSPSLVPFHLDGTECIASWSPIIARKNLTALGGDRWNGTSGLLMPSVYHRNRRAQRARVMRRFVARVVSPAYPAVTRPRVHPSRWVRGRAA